MRTILTIDPKNYKQFMLRDMTKITIGLLLIYSFFIFFMYSVGGTKRGFYGFVLYFGLGVIGLVLIRAYAAYKLAKAYTVVYTSRQIEMFINQDKFPIILRAMFSMKRGAMEMHTHNVDWESIKTIRITRRGCKFMYESELIDLVKYKFTVPELFEGYDGLKNFISTNYPNKIV